MFRVGLWDAFGAGAAASLIAITFAFVAGIGFLQARLESAGLLFALVVVPIAIVVPLVAGAASIATWRTTFLALMRGRSSGYVVQTAGSLAAGVVLCGPAFYGAIFLQAAMGGVGRQYVDQIAVAWSSLLMVALGLVALLIVVLAGALILFLKWVEAGATSWLSVAFHTPSPRAPCAIGILISCVLALAWFSVGPVVFGSAWFALHEEGKSSALSAMWYVLLASDIFPLNFIVWVSLIGFWAFPLGAGLWRPRARTHSGWPFLGTAPRTDPSLEPPLRLLRALLIGAAGGLAAGSRAAVAAPPPAAWSAARRGVSGDDRRRCAPIDDADLYGHTRGNRCSRGACDPKAPDPARDVCRLRRWLHLDCRRSIAPAGERGTYGHDPR